MATTATPAGGSRNGTGPEWGGFEENIQVMASRLRLPAAPGTAVVRVSGGLSPGPGSLLHLQRVSSPLRLRAHDGQGDGAGRRPGSWAPPAFFRDKLGDRSGPGGVLH